MCDTYKSLPTKELKHIMRAIESVKIGPFHQPFVFVYTSSYLIVVVYFIYLLFTEPSAYILLYLGVLNPWFALLILVEFLGIFHYRSVLKVLREVMPSPECVKILLNVSFIMDYSDTTIKALKQYLKEYEEAGKLYF